MELSTQIATAKSKVERASSGLLKTFAAVPDDKLAWSPSETSRSSLWIVGHCAGANQAFARGMRGEAFPPLSLPEFEQMVWETGKGTKTREEAMSAFESSTAAVIAELDAMTPERTASMIDSPFGPIPMALWITFAGDHMMGHLSQIEYLQTTWGDRKNHTM